MAVEVRAAVLEATGHAPPFADARPLRVMELELDPPGPGEVLVRIAAAGVCHSDLSVVDGTRPWPLPIVLGHEAAGVVEEVGPGVEEVEEGDHVVCSFVPSCGRCETCASGRPVLCPPAQAANREGRLVTGTRPFRGQGGPVHHHLGVAAFAERTVVAARSLIRIPREAPLEVAVVFGCAVLTGVGAVLNTARVEEGRSVAVFGLGGVGLSVVMGAVLAGAHPIVAVDRVAAKLERARALGATHVVGADDDPVGTVRDLTGGGVDYAFEAVGSAAVLAACYRALGPGGTAICIGLAPPDQEVALPALALVAGERSIVGSYMGSSAPRRDLPRLIRLHLAGKLPVERLITRRGVALGELNEALDRLARAEEVRQVVDPGRP
jgi:alcohol dehydrogenase